MPMLPEEKARVKIDKQLRNAGWDIVARNEYLPNSTSAVKEALMGGNTESDYLIFIDGKAIAVDEKKRELSVSDEVIVNLGDIQDKFLSLKIRDKMIDKTTMGNALRLFRRYQLIELLESDLKNGESRVLIYNSVLMAVRVEDIKSVYEKVDSYRKGKLKDEEADQTETD